MTARSTGLALLLVGLAGCGADSENGEREPGQELGPCVAEQYCDSPLICTEELICVHPDQSSGTDGSASETSLPDDDSGADPGPDSDDSGDTPSTTGDTPSTTGDAPEIYCSGEDGSCWCSHTADWGFADESCGPADVGNPALCCASHSSWPTTGTCSCQQLYCARDFDTCFCNSVPPEANEEIVDTCYPNEGVCCRDLVTGWCLCWDDLLECPPEDYEPVSSCTVANIDCGDGSQVDSCSQQGAEKREAF